MHLFREVDKKKKRERPFKIGLNFETYFCIDLSLICVFVYLSDILSAFCIPMGCEGTLIDLPFI